MSEYKRKLIEVALPLDAINRESAREKSIRHGHPSTMHLWWARRPLAACRAVVFAQLVDDPSAHPDRFPTLEDQKQERQRLFNIIERLVAWENLGDERLLREANAEIIACFDGETPTVLDPFAGGGSIPLEIQRLGLNAQASDLNPVPVMMNKALIEIPPKWAGQSPIFPGAAASATSWTGSTGLAEDVRRYGAWMGAEASRKIGDLYPSTTLSDGGSAHVLAWLWARTVQCPNPGCGMQMPLLRSLWLSKKTDRPVWLRPVVSSNRIDFELVRTSAGPNIVGTVGKTGAICLGCETPVPLSYIRSEGRQGRLGSQLLSMVCQGVRQKVFVAATRAAEDAALSVPLSDFSTDAELPSKGLGFRVQAYGMTKWSDLFTSRQLVLLTTLSDLVHQVHAQAAADGEAAGLDSSVAASRATAIATYAAFAVDRTVDYSSSLCSWIPNLEAIRSTFAMPVVSMTWDYVEANPLHGGPGNFARALEWVADSLATVPSKGTGWATQANAATRSYSSHICTDPPYYDNVGYADLSDFFYTWMRRSIGTFYPELFSTMTTPKLEELIADPSRHANKGAAAQYFETGFRDVFTSILSGMPADAIATVFYAFKQSESGEEGQASTGWEVLLEGLIQGGWSITATWPLRTERAARSRGIGSNALASSVVLACRARSADAAAVSKRGFIAALQAELPLALRELQQGSVAPVDLAQAAIGPGMAVFSRFGTVVETDGSAMTVRTALALINQVLDEVLSEQEGELNADSRFALAWFTQHAWNEGESGLADQLARAKNTTVEGLERGGIFRARAGKARLLGPEDLDPRWDPSVDVRLSEWEVVVRVAKALEEGGIDRASPLLLACGRRVDLDSAKELTYRLFALCEKKGWAQAAMLFNVLGSSWADLTRAGPNPSATHQDVLDFEDEDEAL